MSGDCRTGKGRLKVFILDPLVIVGPVSVVDTWAVEVGFDFANVVFVVRCDLVFDLIIDPVFDSHLAD